MKVKAILGRFLIIGGLATTAVLVLGNTSRLPLGKLSPLLGELGGKVKGVAVSLNIDPAVLADQAQKKLIDQQDIMESSSSGNTLTTDVSAKALVFTEMAQKLIRDTSQKLLNEVKDLPKEQATKLTKQVCEQIVSDLETKAE